MSRLTVYPEDLPGAPLVRTEDPAEIATELARIGVRFDRWESPVDLPDDAAPDAILAAYRPYLDTLMGTSGAGSADVISLTPDHPQVGALRDKFLSEHIHTEDEVRFFVRGAGNFIMHVDGKVWDAHCTAGDLISVPAQTQHWFDAGPSPRFTALRIFTDQSGWVPHYTGVPIHERFPAA
ncbi:MAG: acireductone dioxygenase [Gemmatimonadaceae bacterium]|nr:acireductone dioxygenase [Acetobacteraceae bacterium]